MADTCRRLNLCVAYWLLRFSWAYHATPRRSLGIAPHDLFRLALLQARHHLVGNMPPLLYIEPEWIRHDGLRPRVKEALALRGAYLGWAGVEAYVMGLRHAA